MKLRKLSWIRFIFSLALVVYFFFINYILLQSSTQLSDEEFVVGWSLYLFVIILIFIRLNGVNLDYYITIWSFYFLYKYIIFINLVSINNFLAIYKFTNLFYAFGGLMDFIIRLFLEWKYFMQRNLYNFIFILPLIINFSKFIEDNININIALNAVYLFNIPYIYNINIFSKCIHFIYNTVKVNKYEYIILFDFLFISNYVCKNRLFKLC